MRVLLTGAAGWLGRDYRPFPFAHDPGFVPPSAAFAWGAALFNHKRIVMFATCF